MNQLLEREKLGRWSLRIDAAFCAVLGLLLAIFGSSIAKVVSIPAPVITGVGVAVVMWAGGIMWMLARLPLRLALQIVMVVNVVAALGLSFASLTAQTTTALVVIVVIAVDVAMFALSQYAALRVQAASTFHLPTVDY